MVKHRGAVLLTDEIDERWLDLMSEAGLNMLGVHEIVSEEVNCVQRMLSRLEGGVRKTLGKFENSGIEICYELHAMEWLLPRERFDSDPQLFRMDDKGERCRSLNCCVSSPEALEIVSERAYLLASLLDQSSHDYCLWPDDSFNSLCRCEKCRRLRVGADHNIIMMRAVLRGLRAYDSRARIAYLAYADFLDPPTLSPEPGMFLQFAPMQRDLRTPMRSEESKENTRYRKLLSILLDIFGTDGARALEYWLDNALNSGFKKPPALLSPNADVIADDIAFYHSMGLDTIETIAYFIGADYRELFGDPPCAVYGSAFAAAAEKEKQIRITH